MIRSLVRRIGAIAVLVGCTSAGPEPVTISPVPEPPASAEAYTIERHPLIAPLPVGLRSEVTVSFGALGETIDVVLDVELIRSGADGGGQLIELVVISVRAGDAPTTDALLPIVGASSRLVRDERRAIVEQSLDVPAGLESRTDAIVRQALRAPFALAGPLVTDPVGAGASWQVIRGDDAEVDITTVDVVSNTAERHVLRFAIADGDVEITGRPDEMLPDEQTISLGEAMMRVVAVPSGQ